MAGTRVRARRANAKRSHVKIVQRLLSLRYILFTRKSLASKMRKRILCICAKGLHRSKYLASYLKNKGYSTRYGGVEGFRPGEEALNPITQADVDWAQIIVITRKRLKPIFDKRFKHERKKIIILDVTDSRRLLPAEYAYLKNATDSEFERKWRRPQLRKAIKKYLPL